jgi:hypothetical protein
MQKENTHLDLQKASDSVNYDILLRKLNFYGIRGPFHKLIKSYLTNRYQRVLIEGKSSYHSSYSEWGKINNGVPPGCTSSPLLFPFYINDLPKIVQYNSKPTLFADETSFIFSNPNYSDFKTTINNVFSQLNKWFDDNLLLLNYEQTQYVHLTLKGTVLHVATIGYNNNFMSNSRTNAICPSYSQRYCSSCSNYWL